jgi:hypothetical protein
VQAGVRFFLNSRPATRVNQEAGRGAGAVKVRRSADAKPEASSAQGLLQSDNQIITKEFKFRGTCVRDDL